MISLLLFRFALLRFSLLDRNPVLRYEFDALQLYCFADFMYDSSSFCFVCNVCFVKFLHITQESSLPNGYFAYHIQLLSFMILVLTGVF